MCCTKRGIPHVRTYAHTHTENSSTTSFILSLDRAVASYLFLKLGLRKDYKMARTPALGGSKAKQVVFQMIDSVGLPEVKVRCWIVRLNSQS